jgi:hypothetical protein
MVIHVDFPPVDSCKHPEWSYGLICVKCGECGRFDAPPKPRSEVQVISQIYTSIPPFWQYPEIFASFHKGEWAEYRDRGKYRTSKARGTLEEVLPPAWKESPRMDYHRWWIEGRNY